MGGVRSAAEIVARAEREIAAGRAWRAKELLRGALATRAERVLLERYGRLLDLLGERYEAGRYLFLSGVRTPECADAIAVFLTRNAARGSTDFVKLFPAAVRRLPFEQLPAVVQEELRARGVGESRFSGEGPLVPAEPRWRRQIGNLIAVLIVALFVAAFGVGIVQILKWIAGFVR